jgi:hypothetical protein
MEAVLALGLLLLATGTVVSGLTAGVQATERVEHDAHATDLAITVLSWIEMGLLPANAREPREFDRPFRDWTHEIEIESLSNSVALGGDVSNPLARVRVTVRHKKRDRELSLCQLVLLPHRAPPSRRARVNPERLKRVRELLTPPTPVESEDEKND